MVQREVQLQPTQQGLEEQEVRLSRLRLEQQEGLRASQRRRQGQQEEVARPMALLRLVLEGEARRTLLPRVKEARLMSLLHQPEPEWEGQARQIRQPQPEGRQEQEARTWWLLRLLLLPRLHLLVPVGQEEPQRPLFKRRQEDQQVEKAEVRQMRLRQVVVVLAPKPRSPRPLQLEDQEARHRWFLHQTGEAQRLRASQREQARLVGLLQAEDKREAQPTLLPQPAE